jgi:hypothetical protein
VLLQWPMFPYHSGRNGSRALRLSCTGEQHRAAPTKEEPRSPVSAAGLCSAPPRAVALPPLTPGAADAQRAAGRGTDRPPPIRPAIGAAGSVDVPAACPVDAPPGTHRRPGTPPPGTERDGPASALYQVSVSPMLFLSYPLNKVIVGEEIVDCLGGPIPIVIIV